MVNITSNVKTNEEAQKVVIDYAKNPPKTPEQAFQWLAKTVNITAVFGDTVSKFIPGAGTIVGALTDIFDVFSSPPSLGQVVLNGLAQLSTQISNIKSEILSAIEKTAELQTKKTIKYTLEGVEEIQKEVSAIQIMQSVINESILSDVSIEKSNLYANYLIKYDEMQSAAYAELSEIINNVQKDLTLMYNKIINQLGLLGFDLYAILELKTNKPMNAQIQDRKLTTNSDAKAYDKSEGFAFNPVYLSPLLLLLFTNNKK